MSSVGIQTVMIISLILFVVLITLPILILSKLRKNRLYKLQLMEENNALLREQNELLKSKE